MKSTDIKAGKFIPLILFLSVTALLFSCGTTKPTSYFTKGVVDSSSIPSLKIPEHRVQKGDILSISIFSDNPEATLIFNQAGGQPSSSGRSTAGQKGVEAMASSSSTSGGYLVDENGSVKLHAIGELAVEGLTLKETESLVMNRIRGLNVLTNPYCIVRFNNFKITVLGEVRVPGVFTIQGNQINVLDALGLAGDFTDYGLKDKVLLIRESDGRRNFRYLDLTNPEVFSRSEFFYLKQNDVLVVRADDKKPTTTDQLRLQYFSLALATVSTIAVVFALFR